jgi:renalase
MTTAIAIIGAGMAGASAAHVLREAGHRVTVLDKGRGIGGRMATRRLPDGTTFDHGAQYVSIRDPAFAQAAASWAGAGAAAPWGEAGWSVGTPGMPDPVRAHLQGCTVETGRTVSRLTRRDGRWHLTDDAGAPVAGTFDTVLVTAPAPQALALADSAGIDWPDLRRALSRVRYAPCWALMLAYAGGPVFPETHRRPKDGAIAWIGRDGTKPGRGATRPDGWETLVVHATPAWSRAHLEEERPAIVARLSAELARLLGPALPPPERFVHALAHRWRYAMVEEAVGEPCLWSPDLGLGVAGDGCLGGRVEAAFLSGAALAHRVCGARP